MNRFITMLLSAVIACTSVQVPVLAEMAPVMHEIYVSPDGNDEATGSKESPFRTVERARDEVRKLNDNMTADINVYLREGVYRLEETLEFTSDDSGTNGYYVNYKSYPGEEAVISGAKKIEGWKKTSDGKMWTANVDGIEYAPQLYVNNRRARRAQSEELIDVDAFYTLPGSKEAADGLISKNTKYASYKNAEDIQLHFARGWRSYTINVERISASSEGSRFLLRQPSLKAMMGLISTVSHSVEPGHNFILENAFEELDVEGEFYYDRSEKKLYYLPRSDENMATAEVELPVLEQLMTIRGAHGGNKVKNITFDSLTMGHTAWLRMCRYGHIGDQAGDMLPEETKWITEPGFTMVPATIQMNFAEKVNFTNNKICDIGDAGIGMYNGVSGCRVEGNAFFDIGDSAVTIGTADYTYGSKETDGTNVAAGKIASASSYDLYGNPFNAIDGNRKTAWNPPKAGPHWLQIDLGEKYSIDRIEIDDRIDSPSASNTRNNIEILASNDADFQRYKVIASLGPVPYEQYGTAVLKSNTDEKFRYVRVSRKEYFLVPEVRVISKDIGTTAGIEICSNNSVTNNVITRIGLMNYGAPGVTAYYVQGMDISHNHFYDIPYSGISEGWGWTNYPDNVECRDNRLNYNLLENHMQVAFDGGGIYMLGNQINTTEIGNYVREQHNNLAALYLDSGSERITLKNNVTEVAPFAFSSAGISANNLWKDNWSTGSHSVINLNENCLIDNNQLIIPGNAPLEAVAVMKNAGVEEKYRGLEEKAGKNYWPVSREMLTNNAKKEIVMGLMGDATFVGQYLTYYIHSAQEWLKIAEVGSGLCQYPQEAVDRLYAALDEANTVVAKEPVNRDDILEARWTLFDRIEEFKNSKITYPVDELVEIAEKELENTVIGSDEGMNAQYDYNVLVGAIKEAQKYPDDEIIKQYLEQSIISLRKNKVNFDILSASLPDQTGSAVIDKENNLVTVPVKHLADLSAIKPNLGINSQVRITPSLDVPQNFTKDVVYTISSLDGKHSKQWTVRAQKPIPLSQEGAVSLKDAIADKDNWNMFSSMNCSNYSGEIYGDITMNFDMEIASREMSYPGFVFRTQDPDKDFTQKGNATYILIFTPGQIEFYRFNDGIRTQFYGPVASVPAIFGGAIQTDAFKLGTGLKNKMEIVTRNEGDGVRLKCTINGEVIFDFVDNYPGAILDAGYIGTVSPDSPVILTAE